MMSAPKTSKKHVEWVSANWNKELKKKVSTPIEFKTLVVD